MNTTNSSPRLLLALCLIAFFFVVPTRATTIKEFYAIPEKKRADFITDSVNAMCDKLRSEYDTKGNRKSPELLKQQRVLARFTIALFDERDGTGMPTAYAKVGSLVYSASLDDKYAGMHVENIIATYALEQFRKKQAADAAAAKPVAGASQVTKPE